MLRSCRNIILPIAGLFLIGANQPPKSGNQTDNTETAKKIDAAAKSISSAIIEAGKPIEQDGGCADGQDRRDSDLCAQWKAADAARDSADFAFWTLLVSTFGTGLLIWTLWETRDSSRRELRAYVRIEMDGQGTIQPDKKIRLPLIMLNYGATPAVGVCFQSSVVVRDPDWKWEIEHAPDTEGIPSNITLHKDSPLNIDIVSEFLLPRDVYTSILGGKKAVFAKGTAEYRDVFGNRRHTSVQYEFHGIDAGNGLDGKLRISHEGNNFS